MSIFVKRKKKQPTVVGKYAYNGHFREPFYVEDRASIIDEIFTIDYR